MSTSGTHAALLALLAIALTGTCAQTPSTRSTTPAELEAARVLWASEGSSDYTMRFQRSCYCIGDYVAPLIVTVQGGVVIDVALEGSNRQPTQEALHDIPTVEGMFEKIARGLEAGYSLVRVTYDPVTGAPVDVYIDVSIGIADEEIGYSIRLLDLATGGGQALPGPSPPLSATATGGPSPPLSATATGGPSPPLSAAATGELLPQSEGGTKGDEEEDDG